MTNDWILRVGNGTNFIKGYKYKIWGISSSPPVSKHFLKNVKPGDRLWFVKGGTGGLILAVATFRSYHSLSLTIEEIGWAIDESKSKSPIDTQINYTDLYNLTNCELLTHINSPLGIRKYNEQTCRIDLPLEYSYLSRYSKLNFEM